MSSPSRPAPVRPQGRALGLLHGARLRRTVPLVLLGSALAGGLAHLVSTQVLPAVYRSSSTVIINQALTGPDAERSAIEPFTNDQSLGETFEQLALQPAVSEQVARDLGMRSSALVSQTEVHAVPRTPLIIISVQGPTPEEAARRTQAYTAQFVESTVGSAMLPGRAMVVSGATRPTEPFAPRPQLNALVAGFAGLLLGLGVLFARALLRESREDVEPEDERAPARAWLVRGQEWQDGEGSRAEPDELSAAGQRERRAGA